MCTKDCMAKEYKELTGLEQRAHGWQNWGMSACPRPKSLPSLSLPLPGPAAPASPCRHALLFRRSGRRLPAARVYEPHNRAARGVEDDDGAADPERPRQQPCEEAANALGLQNVPRRGQQAAVLRVLLAAAQRLQRGGAQWRVGGHAGALRPVCCTPCKQLQRRGDMDSRATCSGQARSPKPAT